MRQRFAGNSIRPALARLGIAPERRRHPAQRSVVEDLIGRAVGAAALVRTGRGSVFVYDEQRAAVPPQTVRAHVWPDGAVDVDTFR